MDLVFFPLVFGLPVVLVKLMQGVLKKRADLNISLNEKYHLIHFIYRSLHNEKLEVLLMNSWLVTFVVNRVTLFFFLVIVVNKKWQHPCKRNFVIFRISCESIIQVKQWFYHWWFNKQSPRLNQFYEWYRKFMETGCMCKEKTPWATSHIWSKCSTDPRINQLKPHKITSHASNELGLPKTT